MLLTWLRTVSGETTSSRAIWLLDMPRGQELEYFPLAVGQLGEQHRVARRARGHRRPYGETMASAFRDWFIVTAGHNPAFAGDCPGRAGM